MITMNNWATQAVAKLEKEKVAVAGQKEKAMADAVVAAIKDFCLQDEEFAQAIVQGGTFADCMKSVAKGVGSYISDLDAYKKAVQFYFPGAKIQMQMTIDLIGDAAGDAKAPTGGGLILNLEDFI
ncbi:MAG: hypothetical protein J6K03_01360 [Oscillospiraceae bacterium]|nr:hypothetical protein [Oscillospiraceae bacterium]